MTQTGLLGVATIAAAAALILAMAGGPATGTTARPASLWWSAVEDFDKAAVHNAMDATVRREAKSGGVSLPAIFLHPKSTGRAIARFPVFSASISNARLFFLAHVGIADGVKWDDTEHAADGVRFYVIMDGRDAAQAYLRSSQWMPIVVPLAEVGPHQRTVKTSISLATDSGPAHNTSYDWALFGQPVVVSVPRDPLPMGQAVPGASGVLVIQLSASGGAVIVEGLDENDRPIDKRAANALTPQGQQFTFLQFDFGDNERCVQWRWRSEGARVAAAWGGSWQPRLVIEHVGPSRAVLLPGQELRIRVAVRNCGPGTLLPLHLAYVECNGRRKPVARLGAGEVEVVEFNLGPARRQRTGVQATASVAGRTVGTAQANLYLWPPPPSLPADRPQRAEARKLDATYLLLRNRQSSWLFNAEAPGLGALVYVWADGRWELAGSVAPWLEILGARDRALTPAFGRLDVFTAGGSATATARGRAAGLDCSITARLEDDSPAMYVELSVTARRQAQVAAVRGPAAHAGDGGTGTAKGMAVFPGLEFLYADERSSSERDLAPPLNKRWTPHKFKITVPMMMVETRQGGPVMGIVWDARQRWDGQHIAPAARFASPDFLTHKDSHLMQLMLPSVPDFIPENADRAPDPVTVPAGRTWRIAQHILAARPTPDATAALRWYDDLVGYPPAEKWPRTFEEEMALCRHGFMVTVWDEATNKSRHCVGWGPANAPGFATLLLMDARAVAKGEEQQRVLERVRLIAEQTLRQEGAAGLASSRNCHIMKWEFPYHWGHLPDALAGMRAEAYGALMAQEEDGGWGYYPDQRRRVLGEPGTRVIGISARNAYVMAKWVAISGDPVMEKALRRALQHMERFKVPRGAQGWECPILEPDVLASAYAVRAYVWACMALGEDRWLEKAAYWARTGLPFQYAWDDGQHPGMRYASIPVFGSTFFRHSWIGLPVQWCGLVYAYGLQELMRFRPDDLWRRQVEGITVSAMYQQWPMDNPKLAGSYPDSFGNWFTRRNPAFINPENIAVNLLALKGLDPGLRSARVRIKGGSVHVSAPAVLSAKPAEGGLDVAVRYLPNQALYLTVAPVAVSDQTRVEGPRGALQRRSTLLPGQEGWAYANEYHVAAVGVRCGSDGNAEIRLRGVVASPPPEPGLRRGWDFERGANGWVAAHACAVEGRQGSLCIRVTGDDPYAISGPAAIDASRAKKLRMRLRLSGGGQVGLFWRTNRSPGWGEDKHVTIGVPADNQWHEVTFDLSAHPLWTGRVLQIRLDIEPSDVPAGTTLEVDWIRPQ